MDHLQNYEAFDEEVPATLFKEGTASLKPRYGQIVRRNYDEERETRVEEEEFLQEEEDIQEAAHYNGEEGEAKTKEKEKTPRKEVEHIESVVIRPEAVGSFPFILS